MHSAYDLAGRRLSSRFDNVSGQGIFYAYDAAGRLLSETSTIGTSRALSFQYDAASNRTRITWPDSQYVTYAYDALNRMDLIQQSGTTTLVDYGYDALGRRTTAARAGGRSSTWGYDNASRLTALTHDLPGTADDQTYGYAYTPARQLSQRTASNDAYAWSAPAVNRPYVRDGLNRYASVNGVAFTYDGRGNNLNSDAGRTFAYDLENRVTAATDGGSAMSLAYDPLGRLRQTTVGSATTQFLYDGDRLAAEYDAAGTLLRRYVHGSGVDEPVVWYEGSGLTDARHLMADERGSIVAVSGASTTRHAYGPYGEPGAWPGPRFRYTGQIALPEVRLYHYKARAYVPGLGRFLQTDPVGYEDDLNLYGYVGNDPVNATDPTGMVECTNNAQGSTNCVTSDYNVTFTTPKGFPGTDDSQADFHSYDETAQSPLGVSSTRDWVQQNPTPGNPSPATPGGTRNDVTPIVGGLPGDISPVSSITATNSVSGNPVVVNVTLPGHPLFPGIVVREVVGNADGTSTIHNRGEGNGALQRPGSPVAGPINRVWRGQHPPTPTRPLGPTCSYTLRGC